MVGEKAFLSNFVSTHALLVKMAVSRVGQTSLLNRLWSGLSAWTVNQSGFQKFGSRLEILRGPLA